MRPRRFSHKDIEKSVVGGEQIVYAIAMYRVCTDSILFNPKYTFGATSSTGEETKKPNKNVSANSAIISKILLIPSTRRVYVWTYDVGPLFGVLIR